MPYEICCRGLVFNAVLQKRALATHNVGNISRHHLNNGDSEYVEIAPSTVWERGVGAALLSLAKPLSSVLAVVKICTMVLAPKCQGEWSDGALVYTQHRLKDRINLMR